MRKKECCIRYGIGLATNAARTCAVVDACMHAFVGGCPTWRACERRARGHHDTRVYFVRRVIKGRCALPTLHTQVIYLLSPSFLEHCQPLFCLVDIASLPSSFHPTTKICAPTPPSSKARQSLILRNHQTLHTRCLSRQTKSVISRARSRRGASRVPKILARVVRTYPFCSSRLLLATSFLRCTTQWKWI